MIAFIEGQYGYQGLADFKMSINESTLYTFINDLYGYPGIQAYFDTVDYDFSDNFQDFEIFISAGNNGIGGGNVSSVPVCLTSNTESPLCTIPGGQISVITEI